jgi:hypothetical protein
LHPQQETARMAIKNLATLGHEVQLVAQNLTFHRTGFPATPTFKLSIRPTPPVERFEATLNELHRSV